MKLKYSLLAAAIIHWPVEASVPAPNLPDRQPFGFGTAATGGGMANDNNTYVVTNMADLRTVLKMDTPRTVYVQGEIKGSEINETFSGSCQYYIDSSTAPEYNFTLYIMSLNATYTDAVKAAISADEPFEGRNATEYLELLNHQNGWRGTVQNVQKSVESIDAQGNLTLIGIDSNAYLNGVSLIFNSRSNIIIRNLRISPPRDCFPSPETYPATWNARYDAISFVTTTTAWLDGNILEDSSAGPVTPEDFIWGWKVDRYDGLFDAEDGTDNVTFSHNIVANHHKSLLWGGGEKEGSRDAGKMRFTVFGNHFVNSLSRNPLMRFGTFYVVDNVFSNVEDEGSLYGDEARPGSGDISDANTQNFEYHLGIYNMSSVLLSGNQISQTGKNPTDKTRFATFNNLATPQTPAKLCSPPDQNPRNESRPNPLATPPGALNGTPLNMTATILATFASYVAAHADSVPGGLVSDCDSFDAQDMPVTFASADDVLLYVSRNAGQVGRNVP
ncbi:polysaccharide lyase family 1 protein [Xylaria intraflava]|nr:polysaccharide lyase family 1 protein [Xylaria intraflava]